MKLIAGTPRIENQLMNRLLSSTVYSDDKIIALGCICIFVGVR